MCDKRRAMRVHHNVPALVLAAQNLLRLNQRQLAETLDPIGASLRSVQRWATGQSRTPDRHLHELARRVYPHDRHLAANLAAAGASSLEELGILRPPAPPAPPPPPAAVLPPPPSPPLPPVEEIIDAIVCAAAEAIDVAPRDIRPALLAAFTRGRKLGLTMAQAEAALGGPKASSRAAVEEPAALTPPSAQEARTGRKPKAKG